MENIASYIWLIVKLGSNHRLTRTFTSLYFPQVKLKRRGTKLQQDIQDRLGKIEKMRHSVNPSKENPKEERIQTEAHVRQLEEEVAELQKKTAELQQLSQTDDNLQFLQVCLSKVKCPFFCISLVRLWCQALHTAEPETDPLLAPTDISAHWIISVTGETCWRRLNEFFFVLKVIPTSIIPDLLLPSILLCSLYPLVYSTKKSV